MASGESTVSSSGGLPGRYAAALYAYAEDQHALDTVVSEMDALGRMLDESADFRRLLESPIIDIAQSRKAHSLSCKRKALARSCRISSA